MKTGNLHLVYTFNSTTTYLFQASTEYVNLCNYSKRWCTAKSSSNAGRWTQNLTPPKTPSVTKQRSLLHRDHSFLLFRDTVLGTAMWPELNMKLRLALNT